MTGATHHNAVTDPRITFLEGWRALSPDAAPSAVLPPLADRVSRLLDGVSPLLRTRLSDAPPPRPALSPGSARRLLEGLRPPLSRARSSGSLIDIWSVAGLRRKELPNAAVLAWLIDPRGSHGQGDLCLTALVDLLRRKSVGDLANLDLGSARVQPEERPLGSDRDRVDIVVETPGLLIFIEVKIDAAEGQAQLSRYVESATRVAAVQALMTGEAVKRTLTVFLSPRPPSEIVPDVVHITWRELAATLTLLAARIEGFPGLLIRSFATHTRSFG